MAKGRHDDQRDTRAVTEEVHDPSVAAVEVAAAFVGGEHIRMSRWQAQRYARAGSNETNRVLNDMREHHDGPCTLLASATEAIASGRMDKIVAALRDLVLESPSAPACFNFGLALEKSGMAEQACQAYRSALSHDSSMPQAHANLGLLMLNQGRLDEAVNCFRNAIILDPSNPWLYSNLGVALTGKDQICEAESCFSKAVLLESSVAQFFFNQGVVRARMGRIADATTSYEKAVSLAPDNPEFRSTLGLALLAQGLYSRGWVNYLDRFRLSRSMISPRFSSLPHVEVSTPPETPVLVVHEQGNGDDIQFCRYLPVLAERFPNLRCCVKPGLVRLLRASFSKLDICTESDSVTDGMHAVLPMMNAPWLVGTVPETIPAGVPYLSVRTLARRWPLRLPPALVPRVGIAWAGRAWEGGAAKIDQRRSLPVESIIPLLSDTQIDWTSLQLGRPGELRALRDAGYPIRDFSDAITDFADTAEIIEQLDLVISADTAVAHLAGALGKPVWLLNRFDSCWRWMADREDSPWYPTMRIFRQTTPGDWAGVIERVKVALAGLQRR